MNLTLTAPQVLAVSVMVPMIRNAFRANVTEFERKYPDGNNRDYRVDLMADYYARQEDKRDQKGRVTRSGGVYAETRYSSAQSMYELPAFEAGALTYPRLTKVGQILQRGVKATQVRAAVLEPGRYLQTAVVMASLGFDVDVYDSRSHVVTFLQKSLKALKNDEWKRRIAIHAGLDSETVMNTHHLALANPSIRGQIPEMIVDIIPGGFLLFQSKADHGMLNFEREEWQHHGSFHGDLFHSDRMTDKAQTVHLLERTWARVQWEDE